MAAEPPYVLLAEVPYCFEEHFWFEYGKNWRDYVSGLGVDKDCLLTPRKGTIFRDKAKEYNVPLHVWTERPEKVYVEKQFPDTMEEILYMYCDMNVAGVFSESVSAANIAAEIGCEVQPPEEDLFPTPVIPTTHHEQQGNTSDSLCYGSEKEADFYAGFAAFVMGVFITACVAAWLHRKRRRRYADTRVVPTHDLDLEMT